MTSTARASPFASCGSKCLSGAALAIQFAMAPNSVRTDPSSRNSVGTLPFGFTSLKDSFWVSPPATSSSSVSYDSPLSSRRMCEPIAQVCGPQNSFMAISQNSRGGRFGLHANNDDRLNLILRATLDSWTAVTPRLSRQRRRLVAAGSPALSDYDRFGSKNDVAEHVPF